jgi:hypothetical protein
MRTCCIALLFSLATCFLYVGAASATELRDPKTGLAVDPPACFPARIGKPMPGDMAEIVVERETPPADCSISFEGSTANSASPKRNSMNYHKKERLDLIRVAMGAVHEIFST